MNHLKKGKISNKIHFFAVDEPRIALILYADDFEVCNPLGMSHKKHKITAVYWILANVPPGLHSTLSAINLAILCKVSPVPYPLQCPPN